MLHHFQSSLRDFSAIPFTASDSFISYNVRDYRDNPDVPFLSGTRDHIEMRDLEISSDTYFDASSPLTLDLSSSPVVQDSCISTFTSTACVDSVFSASDNLESSQDIAHTDNHDSIHHSSSVERDFRLPSVLIVYLSLILIGFWFLVSAFPQA